MRMIIGIDVACRAAHQASCADEGGTLLFAGHRFFTDATELERLWARLPGQAAEVIVVMEPTRNAWVPLAAWFRRKGASVVLVPPERSADLRAYYSKHAKTDRLDSRVLARLPLLHPEGLHTEGSLGPGSALKRAVKLRCSLVTRRSASMRRIDALLEIMGPAWTAALGSDLGRTALEFLARYAEPAAVKRLGRARLIRFLRVHSQGRWGESEAEALIEAAEATIGLWGAEGLDFAALAADIALEARLALDLTREIKELGARIAVMYEQADPDGIVLSAPGVAITLAAQILGRLGDVHRFDSLACVRSFSGLVPHQKFSGTGGATGGPTKAGDSCLRDALHSAADHARRQDPQLAARYWRLMVKEGKHHTSALCSVGAVLLTRIAACLRDGVPYVLRDVDGRIITAEEGKAICKQRYTVPAEVRAARRTVSRNTVIKGRDEATIPGVAKRSKAAPVPASG
jgi:transposase